MSTGDATQIKPAYLYVKLTQVEAHTNAYQMNNIKKSEELDIQISRLIFV